MTLLEQRRIIEVDARDCHPTVVFFTDRKSRYTVAVDKETGVTIGTSAPVAVDLIAASMNGHLDALWAAVLQYERSRRAVQ